MPRPGLRTGRFRKIIRKIPGGALVIHYKKKKPGQARCAACGRPLPGVKRDIPSKIRRLAKSRKRPKRPYGGNLCSRCSREAVRGKILKGG
jgi:large subunit ribosomal protein L34e